jgi:hypothetical protein
MTSWGSWEVRCAVCLDTYGQHAPDGGHCRAVKGEHEPIPCPCPGFRWVPADGPPVGSYDDPPQRP